MTSLYHNFPARGRCVTRVTRSIAGPGEHRLKPVRLRSGVRLRLQAGAHVYGSANCEDYVNALARDGVEPDEQRRKWGLPPLGPRKQQRAMDR